MQVTIYHHPKCAKSRETLKLLETRGIGPINYEALLRSSFHIIKHLKTPPSRSTNRPASRTRSSPTPPSCRP